MTSKEKKDFLEVLTEFYSEIIKPDFDKVNKRLDLMEQKLDEVVKYIKSQNSPSREEFQNLKYKVEKLEISSSN